MIKSTPKQSHKFFPEIQGLRAIAVLVVLIFHLDATWLSGGFVGVDVFFVISGFVITQSLLREVERDNTVSIPMFYVRRVRRLLPAAATVLGFVLLGTALFLPAGQWQQITKEVVASALYFENWVLFFDATNYLALEEAESPIVHFWSLSIEEQFYFVWPFLILSCVKFAKVENRRSTLTYMLIALILASLSYSIYFTLNNPAQAYFSTFTRLWELAVGALLSCIIWRPNKILSILLGGLGLIAIFWSSYAYTGATLFPGYTALLPVLGAAALILSITSEQAEGFFYPLRTKPMLFFGNISYSLYLWHWPVIVFAVAIAGRSLNALELLGVAAISVGAATLSTYGLEDPFRKGRLAIRTRGVALGLAVFSIAGPMAGSAFLRGSVDTSFDSSLADNLLGARALGTSAAFEYDPQEYQPRPEVARKDLPEVYGIDCHGSINETEVISCSFGDLESDLHIAVIGDSHAAQWVPALKKICETQSCKFTSITKSSCPYANLDVMTGKPGEWYTQCSEWNAEVLDELKRLEVDVLIPSQSRIYRVRNLSKRREWTDALTTSLGNTWKEVEEAGIRVVPILDTPRIPKMTADCLSQNNHDSEACRYKYSDLRLAVDPIILASSSLGISPIDMTSQICPEGLCEPIIGNVLVWRDTNHITASYVKTMAPSLYKKLVARDVF